VLSCRGRHQRRNVILNVTSPADTDGDMVCQAWRSIASFWYVGAYTGIGRRKQAQQRTGCTIEDPQQNGTYPNERLATKVCKRRDDNMQVYPCPAGRSCMV